MVTVTFYCIPNLYIWQQPLEKNRSTAFRAQESTHKACVESPSKPAGQKCTLSTKHKWSLLLSWTRALVTLFLLRRLFINLPSFMAMKTARTQKLPLHSTQSQWELVINTWITIKIKITAGNCNAIPLLLPMIKISIISPKVPMSL